LAGLPKYDPIALFTGSSRLYPPPSFRSQSENAPPRWLVHVDREKVPAPLE
jgi:hypothetical protein